MSPPPQGCGTTNGLPRASTGRGLSDLHEFQAWFRDQGRKKTLDVRRIPFHDLDEWHLTASPRHLVHRSGRFFRVEGIRTETNFGPVPSWDQPIINQPEIGILGFLTRVFDKTRSFLVQAKMEPGTINYLQLAPTLQATRSNFTRVHQGKSPPYLDSFTNAVPSQVLVDQLQAEQASRFLAKRNRNMVIEVHHEVEVEDGFYWLTLGQIQELLCHDNTVNMDARSVLSCLPSGICGEEVSSGAACDFEQDLLVSATTRDAALYTEDEILAWLTGLKFRYECRTTTRSLDELVGWHLTEDDLRHESGEYFSVMAVAVEATGREVERWTQPLLEHPGMGLNGFVIQRIRGVLHFLVRACLYPGNRDTFDLGSTVSRSDYVRQFERPDPPPFLDLFRDPDPRQVRYESVQSEEGGRFYHYQNRYMILEVPPEVDLDPPENFVWMTLGQVQDLVRHGYFNIEGRNLLACLSPGRVTT